MTSRPCDLVWGHSALPVELAAGRNGSVPGLELATATTLICLCLERRALRVLAMSLPLLVVFVVAQRKIIAGISNRR